MKTISVKTSELTGAALRYAVAVAAGYKLVPKLPLRGEQAFFAPEDGVVVLPGGIAFEPDRDWSQLGPLKQRFLCNTQYRDGYVWAICRNSMEMTGPDELIAACRAIAAAHWGEYADIPEELVDASDDASVQTSETSNLVEGD